LTSVTWEEVRKSLYSQLDSTKTNKFHIKMLLLIGGGVFVDAYNTVVITPVLGAVAKSFALTVFLTTLLGASVVLGTGIGALFGGYLVDRLGRKAIFIVDLLFFIFIAGISALANSGVELVLLRILVGIGVGLDYPIASSYLSEFVPAKSRGKFMGADIMFYPLGALAAILVGYGLGPTLGPQAWRYLVLTALVPAIVVLLARIGTPESPRWLVEHGKKDSAIPIVEKVVGRKLGEDERNRILSVESTYTRTTYYHELITKFTKATVFLALYYIGYQISFVSTGVLSSLFAKTLGISAESASILFWLDNILAIAIVMAVVDRIGRRPTSLTGWIFTVIPLIALIFIPSSDKTVLLVVYSFLALFLNFQGGLHLLFSSEVVPTRLRATAEGWKQGTARLVAVAFSSVIFPLMPFNYSLVIMAIAAVVGALATALLLPEGKGRSLEEVGEVLKNK
jgi:putative MFS transporter